MKKTEAQLRIEILADEFSGGGYQYHLPGAGIDANWHVTGNADTCVAHCFGMGHGVSKGEGLAVRIAAALNYCRDIPTAHLLAHASSGSVRK